METELAIKVEGLYKKFTRSIKRSMYYGTVDVTRNMLGISTDSTRLRKGEFWSLDNINFELKKGGSLGIIGQNGSGKTTLLRLLTGIFPPDAGSIQINGKLGALIAIGAGFHPQLSGRENIYLNGTILGMSKETIAKKLDSIVKFADIGEFIDSPVATYSSGMNVRLGFSILIHSDQEILLADEALAVGDLSFALKCYRKIGEFRDKGGTLVLVSHSISLVRNTCQKVIWLDNGVIKEYGDTLTVCDDYENFMLNKDRGNDTEGANIINNDPLVHITKIDLINGNNEVTTTFDQADSLRVRLHYKTEREINKPIFSVSILNPENITPICNFTNLDGVLIDKISGEGYVDYIIPRLQLKPAEYRVTITFAENGDINNILEWHEKSYPFIVKANKIVTYGLFNPNASWEIH